MKPVFIKAIGSRIRCGESYHFGLFECPNCKSPFEARIYDVNSGRKRNCGCVFALKEETLPDSIAGCKVVKDLRTIDGRRNAIFECPACSEHFTAIVSGMKTGNHKPHCGCVDYLAKKAKKEQQLAQWEQKQKQRLSNKKESVKKHPLYFTWQGIRKRCYSPTYAKYKNYGGRGIKMCDAWYNSFEQFCKDMGDKPDKDYSIDRINNDGDYEPSICRWATRLEQQNNKRNTKKDNYFNTYLR